MLPLPLKLLRSLVLGESIHHNHDHDFNLRQKQPSSSKTPLLVFLPTRELVTDTYRLATIARDMGMDLYPSPSLSHIIFSYPSSQSSSSSPSHSHSYSSWSSISLSSSLILPNDAVPLSFPSLASSSISHLRSFVSLSQGLFKLVFLTINSDATGHKVENFISHWDCCSFSLFSRLNGDRIDTMEAFSRALAGIGWTLFKTKNNSNSSSNCNGNGNGNENGNSVYLFRKVDSGRVRALRVNGRCRIRELRLPALDFRNAPLRILQYLVLMTDDVFYLA
ncbi:uncharacterized protein LOC123212262 [Mangifera indica]|uniref:uncharacterized protein LOC123212262 n=1 Tax=Mangifera indica TaxID=29780 RepID=UPI001CF9B18D|nr:uncharacterized protein LOC123212262 [Mangifera indica]